MSEIHYPDSNRLAVINMPYEALRNEREMCGALFALLIVLKVEEHESGRGKRYYVACDAGVPLFERLADGSEIPEYRVEFVHGRTFESPDWEARRVNSGEFGFAAIRKTIIRVPAISVGMSAHSAQRYH